MTSVLIKDTQERSTEKGREQHGHRGRDWSDDATSQEFPTATKTWERQGTESPLEAKHCCHVDFELLDSKTMEE